MAENVAMKQELDHLKKQGTKPMAFNCKVCDRKFKTFSIKN